MGLPDYGLPRPLLKVTCGGKICAQVDRPRPVPISVSSYGLDNFRSREMHPMEGHKNKFVEKREQVPVPALRMPVAAVVVGDVIKPAR